MLMNLLKNSLIPHSRFAFHFLRLVRLSATESISNLDQSDRRKLAISMSANTIDTSKAVAPSPPGSASPSPEGASSQVPKKITNAQTVCNERNEKGKLCNGHIKQLDTGGEEADEHLRGDDALFKCQTCGTLYMGPPLGHVRDPDKQLRFVERELTAILQAAGGSLPAFKRSPSGAWVPVEEHGHHAPAAAKPAPAAAKPAAAKPAPAPVVSQPVLDAGAQKAAAPAAKPAVKAKPVSAKSPLGPIPGASGPVPGETFEQKIERLKGVVAEAKRRKELAGGEEASGDAVIRTTPAAATTSGTDSSAEADAHRPAAEAQAATGLASAVPLSPSAATASPVAGPETPADLAPDSVAAKPPGRLGPIPGEIGPVPGETHEQKIERLKSVVAAAKARAGKTPKE
jgi:hypothetical protein